MTVHILSLAARGGEEIAVTFEIRNGEYSQTESFLVSAALVADLRLCVGETTQACYDEVSRGASLDRAVKRGLRLLGYGSCSERALCRKLTEKGIDRELAAEAVERLRQMGYLNEEADALREAERSVAKGWGKRRIAAALFAKGYSDRSVRAALDSLEDAGVDYIRLCAERIVGQAGVVPSEPAARRKLIAALPAPRSARPFA